MKDQQVLLTSGPSLQPLYPAFLAKVWGTVQSTEHRLNPPTSPWSAVSMGPSCRVTTNSPGASSMKTCPVSVSQDGALLPTHRPPLLIGRATHIALNQRKPGKVLASLWLRKNHNSPSCFTQSHLKLPGLKYGPPKLPETGKRGSSS